MNLHHTPVSSDTFFEPRQVISKLMALWYRTIVLEHHQDQDCHFTIETRFSYGGQVRFFLNHHGSIDQAIKEEYWSYEFAEQALIRHLSNRIRKFCQNHSQLEKGIEEAHLDQCNEILEELGDLRVKNGPISMMLKTPKLS
ncbi:MAG: hypothetical protein NPIRA04_20270 [Nitrospirales bacterium]|nr:MAG: hypothetical protein NPIRA04_20270 [Nitrospirales bacterium]